MERYLMKDRLLYTDLKGDYNEIILQEHIQTDTYRSDAIKKQSGPCTYGYETG